MSGRLTREKARKDMEIPDETLSQYEDRVKWTSVVSLALNLCTFAFILYISWSKGSDLELGDVKNPFLQDDNKYTVLGAIIVGVAFVKAGGMVIQAFNVYYMKKGTKKDIGMGIMRTLFADLNLVTSGWLVGQLEVDEKLYDTPIWYWAIVILILNSVDRFLQVVIDLEPKLLCSHTNGDCANEDSTCYLYKKVAQGIKRLWVIVAVVLQLVALVVVLIVDRTRVDDYGDYDFLPTLALILASTHLLCAFIALIARVCLFNEKFDFLVIAFSEYPLIRLVVVMATLLSVVLSLGHMMHRGFNIFNYVLALTFVIGIDITGNNVI